MGNICHLSSKKGSWFSKPLAFYLTKIIIKPRLRLNHKLRKAIYLTLLTPLPFPSCECIAPISCVLSFHNLWFFYIKNIVQNISTFSWPMAISSYIYNNNQGNKIGILYSHPPWIMHCPRYISTLYIQYSKFITSKFSKQMRVCFSCSLPFPKPHLQGCNVSTRPLNKITNLMRTLLSSNFFGGHI